jgi:hypothetical protein
MRLYQTTYDVKRHSTMLDEFVEHKESLGYRVISW